MEKKTPRISDSEWKVMEEVWKGPPVTAQEVTRSLEGEAGWKPQTVKTLLGRLVKKGALSFECEGNRYFYSPEISRDEAIAAETDSFLDRICRGSLTPMLAHFVETGRPLDDEEASVLRKLLRQGRESDSSRKTKSS